MRKKIVTIAWAGLGLTAAAPALAQTAPIDLKCDFVSTAPGYPQWFNGQSSVGGSIVLHVDGANSYSDNGQRGPLYDLQVSSNFISFCYSQGCQLQPGVSGSTSRATISRVDGAYDFSWTVNYPAKDNVQAFTLTTVSKGTCAPFTRKF